MSRFPKLIESRLNIAFDIVKTPPIGIALLKSPLSNYFSSRGGLLNLDGKLKEYDSPISSTKCFDYLTRWGLSERELDQATGKRVMNRFCLTHYGATFGTQIADFGLDFMSKNDYPLIKILSNKLMVKQKIPFIELLLIYMKVEMKGQREYIILKLILELVLELLYQ